VVAVAVVVVVAAPSTRRPPLPSWPGVTRT
jgi:hypothetical protein